MRMYIRVYVRIHAYIIIFVCILSTLETPDTLIVSNLDQFKDKGTYVN